MLQIDSTYEVGPTKVVHVCANVGILSFQIIPFNFWLQESSWDIFFLSGGNILSAHSWWKGVPRSSGFCVRSRQWSLWSYYYWHCLKAALFHCFGGLKSWYEDWKNSKYFGCCFSWKFLKNKCVSTGTFKTKFFNTLILYVVRVVRTSQNIWAVCTALTYFPNNLFELTSCIWILLPDEVTVETSLVVQITLREQNLISTHETGLR